MEGEKRLRRGSALRGAFENQDSIGDREGAADMGNVVVDALVIAGLAIGAGMVWYGLVTRARLWWRGRRKGRGQFCPGPKRRWWQWLWPWRWVLVSGCWYDLSRSVKTEGKCGCRGRCPECGREIRRRRELWSAVRRWRPARIGVVVLVVAVVAGVNHRPRWKSAAAAAPSPVLVLAEMMLGKATPHEVRREVRRRLENAEFGERDEQRAIRLLVDDLRTDTISFNALEAIRRLMQVRDLASHHLQAALHADDWQQRVLACYVLQGDAFFEPTAALFAVSLESLRADRGVKDVPVHSATRYFFYRHWQEAKPWLIQGMTMGDWHQREYCAVIAARDDDAELISFAAPILLEQLRSGARRTRRADVEWAFLSLREQGRTWFAEGLEHGDQRQRTYCAVAAVRANIGDWTDRWADRIAPALLEAVRVDRETREVAMATDALMQMGAAARAWAAAGLEDEHWRVRLVCAAAAARMRDGGLLAQAGPILVSHLRDNDIDGDAGIARAALLECGDAAMEYLRSALLSDDRQQREEGEWVVRKIAERTEPPFAGDG